MAVMQYHFNVMLHHNPHFGCQSDGHNPYQISRRDHTLIEVISGFNWSHWLPLSGWYSAHDTDRQQPWLLSFEAKKCT